MVIEEAQVEVHEADQPAVIDRFPDADGLSGEHHTQVEFRLSDLPLQTLPDVARNCCLGSEPGPDTT